MIKITDKKTDQFVKCQGKSIESKLNYYLKEIDKVLDYDIYIVFQFNSNRNVALTKSYYIKGIEDIYERMPHSIFFQKNSKYMFNELISKKEIIECTHEDNTRCLFHGLKREIYIPLFSLKGKEMYLIGCLYCGIYREIDMSLDVLPKKIQAYEYISNISYLLELSMTKTNVLSNITNTIHVLLMILEQKDSTLFSHSYDVANWCKELGSEINLDEYEIKKLYIAGLLHDVGKAFIDDSIINKKGKLTYEEYEIVKKHSLYSYNISKKILSEYPDLCRIPEIIKYHHERYDGEGYPDGLKKDEIPFYSYILSISDSIDAMLSDRPYKNRYSVGKVIRELQINKGKQFHPELVDAMISILSKAQRDYKSVLYNQLSLCYLIVNYKEDVHVLQGILTRHENYYKFNPNDEIKASRIKFEEIISVEMVIKDSTTVLNYKINIVDIKNNEFFISSIELMDSPNSFNLLWDLEGILYLPKENKQMLIHISQIGGDSLRFCSKEIEIFKKLKKEPLKIDILFDECTVDVTGIIIKSYNLGYKQYCDFKYTEIPDFKRDKIFRQLFRKQIEIRKMINYTEN